MNGREQAARLASRGTPLDKAPDPELGHGLIARQRYTDSNFMQRE